MASQPGPGHQQQHQQQQQQRQVLQHHDPQHPQQQQQLGHHQQGQLPMLIFPHFMREPFWNAVQSPDYRNGENISGHFPTFFDSAESR